MKKKALSGMLSILIVLSILSGCSNVRDHDDPYPTDPGSSGTAPTLPTATAPAPTQPETTMAATPTVPETTVTEPTVTEPTIPETTATEPTATEPTVPETTATEPTVTKPTVPETTATEPTVTEPTVPEPPTTEPTVPEPTKPEKPKYEFINAIHSRAELEAMDTTLNAYGQGIHVNDQNRPYGALDAQAVYGAYDAFFIAPADGSIYLTFDEGYENGYTPQILDVLKAKNVKAVFFVTMDYCKREPDLVRRMIDEGHAVGNHSVHHKSMPTLTIDEMADEVMVLHEYVKEHFNYEMHLFRPPMGQYSEQSLAVVQNLGYKTVDWSFAYYDYEPEDQPEQAAAYDRIVGAAHSGAIYLLHAVSETNTAILGDVIDALLSLGYDLKLFN